MKRSLRRFALAFALLLALGLITAIGLYLKFGRSPDDLLRYAEHRLQGHPRLEMLAQPLINAIRATYEHPVPANLPDLGKGAQPLPFATQTYDAKGLPLPALRSATSNTVASMLVHSEAELRAAMTSARPGQVIELAPGIIAQAQTFKTTAAGAPGQPIIVRAAVPGTATIEFVATVGFDVSQPYWVFENLVLRGKCSSDSACEHAFHVFGDARGLVIRNNRLEDFNAQIKVNGLNGSWPDGGLIQGNTLSNAKARQTDAPVTPIDIVGANAWTIADNLLRNFVKDGGNGISYGMFVKGDGHGSVLERNLVICSTSDIGQAGARVGISAGGGGTAPAYCRDKRCDTEQTDAIIRNNVVAHCNDTGIDVNRANQTHIVHNTLINTAGISVRNAISSANIEANLLAGRIQPRDNSLVDSSDNGDLAALENPDSLLLNWTASPPLTDSRASSDFCGKPREARSPRGAVIDIKACTVP